MKTNNRCYTYFTIVGDFDPIAISNRLGIEPCESWKKGDLRRNGSVHESSRWSCGRCDEYDPDVGNQLRKTIADLQGKAKKLRRFARISTRISIWKSSPNFMSAR